MASSEYQDQTDDQIEEILPAFWEWLKVQDSKWRVDADTKKIHLSRGAAAGDGLLNRPSVGKRICLPLAWCFIIVLGGALAWHYSGDAIIVRNWEIPLISLTSAVDANSSISSDVAAERASKGSRQTAPVNQVTSEAAAARSSAELQHQLDSIGNDIVVVRRIIDRLAARQEQTAQGITMLQFTEHNVIEGLSSLPQSTTVRLPQRQNVQRIVQSEGVGQANPVHVRPRPAQTPLPLR
jgi:hypothetical protein